MTRIPSSGTRSTRVTLAGARATGSFLAVLACAAACGSDGPVDVGDGRIDYEPPRVALRLEPDWVGRGSTVWAVYELSDDAGLDRFELKWSGACEGSQTWSLYGSFGREDRAAIAVSQTAAYADLQVTLVAVDLAGRSDSASATIPVMDDVRPEAFLELLDFSDIEPVLAPGDRLRFVVTASDNDVLTWVGYAMFPEGPRDSVPAAGPSHTVTFDIVIPPDWVGMWDLVSWARDASGNEVGGWGWIVWIVDGVSRPMWSVETVAVDEMAHDAKRNVLFVSHPGTEQVGAVSLDTHELLPAIDLPYEPAGIALTPSHDSLFVVFWESENVGLIDLTEAAWQLSLVPLEIPADGLGHKPVDLAIDANNKMFVLLHDPFARLLEFDLNTGQQRIRTDAGNDGQLGSFSVMTMSHDGGTMVLQSAGPQLLLYDAGSDTFAAPVTVQHVDPDPYLSVDATGTWFLLGNALFDADLAPVRSFTPLGYWGGEDTEIGPDGSVAYFAAHFGFNVVRTGDGTIAERVLAPFGTIQLVIPELDVLVINQGYVLTFVDLAAAPEQVSR